jgi:hypothetical protein
VSIRSFSDTHDWDPDVLNDTDTDASTASMIIDNIEHGRCPRCAGPLPQPPDIPAGSRITQCRSIPICSHCGSEEADEFMLAFRRIGRGMLAASEWPVRPKDQRDEGFEAKAARVPLSPSAAKNPHNTGGWAQYGHASERGAG